MAKKTDKVPVAELSPEAEKLASYEGALNELARIASMSLGASKSESMGYTNARQCIKAIQDMTSERNKLELYEKQLAELQRKNDLLERQSGAVQRTSTAKKPRRRSESN